MKRVVSAIMVSMFFIASDKEISSGQDNVPVAIRNDFVKQNLDEQYEIAFHINPFYLRGDFNLKNAVEHPCFGEAPMGWALIRSRRITQRVNQMLSRHGGRSEAIWRLSNEIAA